MNRTMLRWPVLAGLVVLALAGTATAHATNQFVVQCAYSHSAQDDPIVYPGLPGASHLHDFMGNTTTDAFSTLSSLQSGPSTCGTPAGVDNAAYWMPAMWIGQTQYLPKYARVYYVRDAPAGVTVVPYPPGAEMIAGDKTSMTPSPGIVSFSCGAKTAGDSPTSGQAPYDCKPYLLTKGDDSRDGLIGRVIFPHCWDGTGTQPADFTGYAATCPTGTLYVPRLRISFHYFACGADDAITTTPGPSDVTFGSVPGEMPWTGLHADFFNAWDQNALQAEITKALNTQPNTSPLFFGKKVGDPGTPVC
jgi:hypothetical protein